MKKFLLIFSAIFLAMSTIIHADVIYQPEDKFYRAHEEECVYVPAVYFADGVKDQTTVYKSPDYPIIVGHFPNGEQIRSSFQWEDWIYADIGWVHSDDVSRKYDSTLFMNDHQTTEYQDDGYSVPLVQMYTYPNSGECYELIEDIKYATIGETIQKTYTDNDGLKWGYIGYYKLNDGWICMDDPTNTQLNEGYVAPSKSISQLRGDDAEIEPPFDYMIVATVMVAMVAAVTALLIWRKKKR